MDAQLFFYETALNSFSNESDRTEFYKLVEVLDQTIAPGLEQYLRENEKTDLTEKNISKKIGRVMVQMSEPINNSDYTNSDGVNVNDLKNTEEKKGIETATLKAYNSLMLKDYARVDIILKDGIPYVLEINSLPGLMRDTSALYRMAEEIDLGYEGLILKIVNTARKRYGI